MERLFADLVSELLPVARFQRLGMQLKVVALAVEAGLDLMDPALQDQYAVLMEAVTGEEVLAAAGWD